MHHYAFKVSDDFIKVQIRIDRELSSCCCSDDKSAAGIKPECYRDSQMAPTARFQLYNHLNWLRWMPNASSLLGLSGIHATSRRNSLGRVVLAGTGKHRLADGIHFVQCSANLWLEITLLKTRTQIWKLLRRRRSEIVLSLEFVYHWCTSRFVCVFNYVETILRRSMEVAVVSP